LNAKKRDVTTLVIRDITPALTALKDLLKVDLARCTDEQERICEAAIAKKPSSWELIIGVKNWALALANTCRSYAARCSRIYYVARHQEPAHSAVGNMLLALCDHLNVDHNQFYENDWPQPNRLHDFVLHVSGAPLNIQEEGDTQALLQFRLPRWEPKSTFARALAGLDPHPPAGQDPRFLSINESIELLHNLEEFFRFRLLQEFPLLFSEAVLATFEDPSHMAPEIETMFSKKGIKPRGRPKSILVGTRRVVIRAAAVKGFKGLKYCRALDDARLSTPLEWQRRDNCPKDYTKAWEFPDADQRKKLRQRISDEKHKATRNSQ
jgi:hypothetical protein